MCTDGIITLNPKRIFDDISKLAVIEGVHDRPNEVTLSFASPEVLLVLFEFEKEDLSGKKNESDKFGILDKDLHLI